jgi:hypothetical protein
VKITAHKTTKATRANARWKALDHGTEITNNTAPTPRKRFVPKEPGAKICHTYPARKTIPSPGRNPSRYGLTLSVLRGLSVFSYLWLASGSTKYNPGPRF